MATATCTSELFVTVIGTFLTESDIGVGTVVGSGVYNTLGVSACAGLATNQIITMEKWPLIRDSGVYVTAASVLAAVAMDNVVMWYEALIMVVMYFGYFVFLFQQHKLVATIKGIKNENPFQTCKYLCTTQDLKWRNKRGREFNSSGLCARGKVLTFPIEDLLTYIFTKYIPNTHSIQFKLTCKCILTCLFLF